MKERAVRFVEDALDDPDRADEIERESVQSYADRKKIEIENPKVRRSTPVETTMTKAELVETVEQLEDILDDALDPKLTREEVVEKIEEGYALVAGEEDDDEADEADEDED